MKYLFLTISALLILSCAEENSTKEKYLPPSSGTHNELVIVCHDTLWRGLAGKMLIETFAQEQEGLPQSEGIFQVTRIPSNAFAPLFKKAKSIVLAEFADTNFVIIEKDVWARPQVVVSIFAKNERDMYKLIRENGVKMTSTFHQADLHVVRQRMKGQVYSKLPDNLKNDLGISQMVLNLGFDQTLDKPEIKIFRQQTRKTQQFLILYKRKVNDDLLPAEDIIAARDSIGKAYFEGAFEDSYFATEMLIEPVQANTTIGGNYTIETRGLWKAIGDQMGGPFINFAIYINDDEMLMVEGLLYGPDAKKRNILLEMEAMITSIQFEK